MFGKYFSRKKTEDFYLPGEEIRINKNPSFGSGLFCSQDPLSVCKSRVAIAIGAFALAYLYIAGSLFNLCVTPNLEAEENAAPTHFAQNPIRRADIIDRNGTIIATSLPTVNLQVNLRKVRNPEKTAHNLVNILPELDYDDTLKKLRRKKGYVTLKRNLTPSQQYQINYLGNPSLEFLESEKRIYPHKNLLAHIIGKTNIDNEGVSGIEKAMNERLTKSDVPLQLSIDVGVQYTVREALKEGIKKFKPDSVTAVLMDVNTSEILAMVSMPDFDPNTYDSKNQKALFNMATMGVYEPGSILKVFNTAMSLESGKVKVSDSFDASKPLKLKSRVVTDYHAENRWLSVAEILVHSSNIGSAQMALRAGGTEQRNFLEKVGFFDKLDIELAEKGRPIAPRRWDEGTVASVAYGYGVAVSPLHVVTGYSSIVNGGIYHSPTLIKGSAKTKNGYRVVSYNTSKNMRKLLRMVVTDGSGRRANVPGYEVGGKTGTANLIVNGKYVKGKVRTSFVSAFPISDPKYALIVTYNDPKSAHETWKLIDAGWNAVPTASNIISAVAPQLNLKANFDIDEQRRQRIIEASY